MEAEVAEQVRYDKLQAEHTIAGLRAEQQTLAQSCGDDVATLRSLSRESFGGFCRKIKDER